jgi:hypothetical protein
VYKPSGKVDTIGSENFIALVLVRNYALGLFRNDE